LADFSKTDRRQDLFHESMARMSAGQWLEAEKPLRACIAMSDCLPQPNGNLGICLMMQDRYDEAEAAFRQALKIDPKYDRARQNLKLLADVRQTGQKPIFGGTTALADEKDLKVSMSFVPD
jgi:Flp pilus assembly protein TadD